MLNSLDLSRVIYPEPATVAAFMEQHGGSFMAAIAGAWRRADPENRELIQTTWAAEWDKFEAQVRRMG